MLSDEVGDPDFPSGKLKSVTQEMAAREVDEGASHLDSFRVALTPLAFSRPRTFNRQETYSEEVPRESPRDGGDW